jgi:glycosidase
LRSRDLAALGLALLGTAAAHAAPPAGWQHGAFMEIFVRAYQDSDGDGIGDLRGLTQRLPYLRELGVSGLWLMPITASSDRDHGYATTDFRALEPQYGSMADFDAFIRAAHRQGIGVIMDYVVNHASREHPMFRQALQQGSGSRYRDWFVWQQPAPEGWDIWGKNPWYAAPDGSSHYFGTFGPHMPDFNLRHRPVLDYHLASLRFWLDRGLDGFRLDAVPHLVENSAKDWNDQPESRRLTKRLQDEIRRGGRGRRYVVCEATANPQAYAAPEVCGSAFAFGLEHQIIAAARGEPAGIRAVADYFKSAPPSMATMLANHDIFAGQRIWDQLAGDEARYKLAAASYLLMPGTPFIYYGEEIGMAGVKELPGDEPLRAPMSWSADLGGFTSAAQAFRPAAPNIATHNAEAQARDPGSILNFYKAMLRLRNGLPSIARGSYEAAQVIEGQALTFQRRWDGERSLVLINYGEQPLPATVAELPPEAALLPQYPAAARPLRSDSAGRATIPLPARSVAVYRLLGHARP